MKNLMTLTVLALTILASPAAHALSFKSVLSVSEMRELCYYVNNLQTTASNTNLDPRVKIKLVKKDFKSAYARWTKAKIEYPTTAAAVDFTYQSDIEAARVASSEGNFAPLLNLTRSLAIDNGCNKK